MHAALLLPTPLGRIGMCRRHLRSPVIFNNLLVVQVSRLTMNCGNARIQHLHIRGKYGINVDCRKNYHQYQSE